MFKAGLALILMLFCAPLHAAEFYQGIRQMGMGGAAIATVNDETSLLLNPIGLGRLREPYVTLIDPEVTANTDSIGSVQELGLDSTDLEKVYEELGGRLDEHYFVRAQMFPSFATRNYGLGLLGKNEMLARRRSGDQFLELDYISDLAAVGGYNHSFFGGQVKVGVTGRYIDRVQYAGAVDPLTQGLNIKSLASSGTALAGDVGISLSSPTDWLPTLAVMIKDVGDTSFTLGKGMRDDYTGPGDPTKVPMTVDIAAALFPIWSRDSRGTVTIEYDDVTEEYDLKTTKRLHAGLEINMADRLFFRGGYNKGYLTAGFEFATANFQLQLAYYGEEIGTKENPIQDDRISVKTVFRF